ncbi:hypothetical protein GCM10007198_29040 [Microbacterium aerolatum]|uniref:Uncharacterized protein n=2 Tax=Microbacterium aerolatum TaxID=153731 RepID=A0A511AFR5_9MICO|nr:hypothetical protein MAE01_00230 [Microbacterium aerolatum]GGB36674.1 hypothetical protein GCM10007198_29040 [Microbacterium aerolatum]
MARMLRLIDPSDTPPPVAYRVPWFVRRTDPSHPVVINGSAESADFVRVFRDDRPDEGTQLWGQVLPTEDIELCLCAADIDDVVVTLAWFRPTDGLEYVWRFVV